MPKVEKIWGLNLPGTPRATSACRGIPLLYMTPLCLCEFATQFCCVCVCVCVCVCAGMHTSYMKQTICKVLTGVLLRIQVLWEMMLSQVCFSWHFRGSCPLHVQGQAVGMFALEDDALSRSRTLGSSRNRW